MIDYGPFWATLKASPENWYTLVNKRGVNPNTLHRMKIGKGISTATLDDLCRILNCRVEDVLVYIPSENPKKIQ